MDLPNVLYFTAIQELLADCVLVQLVSESLAVAHGLFCFAYNLVELALHSQGHVYLIHDLLGTCLTSSAPCSSCPQLAEASPRSISSSDILLPVLPSFITGGGSFYSTVECLYVCDQSRVFITGKEDPLA